MVKVNSLMSTENSIYCCHLYVLLYLTDSSFTLPHFHGNDKHCPARLIMYRLCKVVFRYRYPCNNSQPTGVSAAAGSTCSVIKQVSACLIIMHSFHMILAVSTSMFQVEICWMGTDEILCELCHGRPPTTHTLG